MLVSRAFLQATGPMREDYFLYCEEVEWCLRTRAKGMAFGFAPEARVLHNQGASTGPGQSVRTRPRLPLYLDERKKMLVTRVCFAGRLPIAAVAALALDRQSFLQGKSVSVRGCVGGCRFITKK